MTLEELREQSSDCVRCPLSLRRTNVVFGEGSPNSPLVLIGEGPGDHEDRSGRPFVGKAGQLLDRAFSDAGIERAQVYITNTVKCRAADWSTGKPRNRPPTDEETQACRHWLIPQLGVLSPKVLLCIGAPSAKNLIRKNFKITAERGLQFPSDYAEIAIATLHPSFILRNQYGGSDGGYSLLVDDIKNAWSTATHLLNS